MLLCDGAGWHQRGKKLSVPDNISLLSLPAYSPELNPMENVWAYLRQNKLCALVWDTHDEILDACQSAWRFLINDPDRASDPSEIANGRVSAFRRAGIILFAIAPEQLLLLSKRAFLNVMYSHKNPNACRHAAE